MLRSLSLLALLTLTWGFNWPVNKIGVTTLPPLWFRSIGVLLGTLLLAGVLVMRGSSLRIDRGTLVRVFVLALPNVIVWYAVVTVALTMLPAGRAAILGFTMPVWAAVIATVFYRDRLDARVAAGVGCAIVAVVLLVAGDWSALGGRHTGIALMLFAAATWAWGTHLMERSHLPLDTLSLTFWMFALSCPVLFGASALFEATRWRVPVGLEWWPIVYNAVLVIALGNAIWFGLARSLPPTTAGLSTMLIPVIGVFSSAIALGEVPSWRDDVALVLVCVAVALALWPKTLRKHGMRDAMPGTNGPA